MARVSRRPLSGNWGAVSILLSGHDTLRLLSARHLARPEVTDVISFCYPPMPGDDGRPTGEVIVNLELAIARGEKSRRMPPSRELALYLAHGCDHLTGENDDTPQRRRRMRRRELGWIRDASRLRLVNGLIS